MFLGVEQRRADADQRVAAERAAVGRAAHSAKLGVAAVGKPKFVTGDMIKPGAVVIDIGINQTADGGITGDVDFASASEVAGHITPVPGGVGPMTITMLLVNTIEAAERSAG